MRWLLWLVAVALAGCTDDPAPAGDGNGTTDPPMTESPTEPSPPDDNGTDPEPEPEPRDPVTWHITIQGNQFVDGSLTIQVGDRVVWTHEDGATMHTVTSEGNFHSGDCPGTTCMTEFTTNDFPYTFSEVGDYEYFCEVHPSMRETITVLEVSPATP